MDEGESPEHKDTPGSGNADSNRTGTSGGQAEETTYAEEMREKLLRALADAENARKRADRSRIEGREAGMAELMSALAPALDNLDLAISSAKPAKSDLPGTESAILEGLSATKRAIDDALAKAGIEILRPGRGEVADPALHEIISSIPTSEVADGQIVEAVQCGYRIGSRLIRPARVVVAASTAES